MAMKFGGWFAVIAAAVIVGSCNGADDDGPASSASTASGSSSTIAPRTASAPRPTTPAAPATTAAPAPPGEGPGERVTLSEVVDGDTFALSDGRRVRVLGIDSCEMNTPGGREARNEALPLQGGTIILRTEPGVDTDQHGRLLRYVQTMVNGQLGDYSLYMVRYDHTGVYQGDNDASAEYVRQLYAADLTYALRPPSGRECGAPDPPPPPTNNDDDDAYVPVPDNDDDGGRRGGGSVCGRFNPFC